MPADEAVGGVAVSAAALQFGAVVVLGKIAARRGLPVPSLLAFRFGIAAILLALSLVALRRSLRPARGEGWRLLFLGGVGYGVEAGFFFLALQRGTAAAVSLLFFTYPVWVATLGGITGRDVPGRLVLGSLAAAGVGAGLVIVSSGGIDISGVGVAFAVTAAVTFSVYLMGVDHVLRRSSSITASMLVSAGASLGLGLFALASGTGEILAGGREWYPVVGMGVFTAGAFMTLFVGLRRLGPVRTAIVAAMEPVATAGLAVLFLNEQLRSGTVVGGVLIVGAAVAASLARHRPQPEVP